MDKIKSRYNKEAEYYDDLYSEDYEYYPSNRLRRDLVNDILTDCGNVDTVLDIGCGTGQVTLTLLEEGFDVEGFDFAEKMVNQAQNNLREQGYNPNRIKQGDLLEDDIFDQRYDSALAIGVLPHFEDPEPPISAIRQYVKDDAEVLIQFRNDLFDLFSFNKHTYEFIVEELLDDVSFSEDLMEDLKERLRDACNVNKREVNAAYNEESKFEHASYQYFHNPLTVSDHFETAGFEINDIYWSHYHAIPPEFEQEYRDEFYEKSMGLEDPTDWRGHFMASMFIVHAQPV